MPGPVNDMRFGAPAVPADGATRGWIRPPYPGPEVPRGRSDYAVDILRHLTDRCIMVTAAQVVHAIYSRPDMTPEMARQIAWNHVRLTAAASRFPFLALGFLSRGGIPPGTTSEQMVKNGFIDAVFRSVREDFGMEWARPELYRGNRNWDGLWFRAPASGRNGPWARLSATPPPDDDGGCDCQVCRRARGRAPLGVHADVPDDGGVPADPVVNQF